MTKLSSLFIVVFLFSAMKTSAAIRLIALINAGNPTVTLQWNMVNYPGMTTYILFKSSDGVAWETAAANPVFRKYTTSTKLAYRDVFSGEQKIFYRVKIYDTNKNIVDISNTAVVANPVTSYPSKKPLAKRNTNIDEPVTSYHGNIWQIFPNLAHDILNLIYQRNEIIKGVINIVIQDALGKVVVRFRAASTNKQLHLSVNKLHAGIYFIKINVENEIQLNDKFIKQ
ncbi:T9SS type A sorting domain-containing protein [Ginsengibacter hankyongi]|uniref:T9SS type A sorting domain-containing protein n=1 Tax=Ginsengibacter hankyongi TaxID=2607284 RepID=A0A5J5IEV2_9BACT|nr:T9SS type A sorting domain-containing protein [Ginsengibacter hankyongi]KAA9037630.1 T9SS type A sorting domain-containing protein [Ginsengibacter hankyongi]